MAEQTQTESPWERIEERTDESSLPPDLPNAHLDEKEGEVQPPGWQPYVFFKQKITEFLNNPKVTQYAHLRDRIVFTQTDIPSIRIAEAKAAFVEPDILLAGEEIDRSQTKVIYKFFKPSPETTLKVLDKVLQRIWDWNEGREKNPTRQSTFNTKRKPGLDRNAPHPEPLNYRQKLYIYGAHDRPGEVVVAIA